jgi:hypothetical protein
MFEPGPYLSALGERDNLSCYGTENAGFGTLGSSWDRKESWWCFWRD